MPVKTNIQFPVVMGLFMVVLLAVGGALVIDQANQSRASMPKLWQVPTFEFVDQNGKAFGAEDLKGKINVVDFIFTSCRDVCPVMTARMADLYRLYADYDFVRFVSISVDPQRDSLAVLREYAASLGVADKRWVFLRAPIEEVVRLMEEVFKLPADDLPEGHSSKFILVDQNGFIRSYYDSFDDRAIETLENNIRELARAGR